ncbi:MAG: HEAT repeat domain-containing protein [Thermoanaerobaculia bacterium]
MNDGDLIDALRRDSQDQSSDVRQKVARILMERSDAESLSLLVRLAGDPDWRVRKAAIEGLEANPSEDVVRALIPALYDQVNAGRRNAAADALRAIESRALPYLLFELNRVPDPDSRIAIATVLGDIPGDESVAALISLLAQADVNVASAAIVSLGKLGRREPIPALIAVLSGDNPWLHYHAIETLGRLKAVEALPAIMERDQNPALKKAILEAAGAIGGFGAIDLLATRLTSSTMPDFPLLQAFVSIDESPRPRIVADRERAYLRRKFRESVPAGAPASIGLAVRKTERPDRKGHLLRALGWIGAPESLPILLAALGSDSSEAAERALEDFGAVSDPALLSLLSPSADEQKAETALKLLSTRPAPAMIFPVLGLLEHDSPAVRRRAVELLAKIADARALDYLVAHLGDSDAGVDNAAVDALSALIRRHPEQRDPLQRRISRAAGGRDALTRANALSLMFEIGSEEFRARVSTASKDEDAVVRARAVTLAARSQDASLAPLFDHALADENALVRQAAVVALSGAPLPSSRHEAILASLQDDDLWVRAAACRGLGALGEPEDAERLAEISENGEAPERIAALEALGRIGGGKAWESISRALDDPDAEIRQAALAAVSDTPTAQADRELDRLASDPDWRLRATALEALGRRGREDRRPLLHQALLEDPDDVVARSALNALERIAAAPDVPVLVRALSRSALAEDVIVTLARLRPKLSEEIELAWREAEPRTAALLAEVLRSERVP